MAIEFQCAECQALIRVPDDASGKQGTCPQCGVRLLVPEVFRPADEALVQQRVVPDFLPPVPAPPPPPAAPPEVPTFAATPPDTSVPTFAPVPPPDTSGAYAGVQPTGSPYPAAAPPGAPVFQPHPPVYDPAFDVPPPIMTRRRRRRGPWGLLIPVVAFAMLGGAGYWLLNQSEPVLEGNLVAERLLDIELPPVKVDAANLEMRPRQVRMILEFLEIEPLSFRSQLLGVDFRGTPTGVEVAIRSGSETMLYRVDPREDAVLKGYLERRESRLDAPRLQELAVAVPRFFEALEEYRRKKGESSSSLVEYRSSVGLATAVRGLGYCVHAAYNQELYPCIYVDAKSRLYFALPAEAKSFRLIGRGDTTGRLLFSGTYQVRIEEEAVEAFPVDDGPASRRPKLFESEPGKSESEDEMMSDEATAIEDER